MKVSKRQFNIAVFGLVVLASWLGWRCALGAWLSSNLQQQTRPQIEIQKTVWDFGTVKQGAQLEANFIVRDVGSERLLLIEQSQSCACLSAMKPEVIVPPGREAKIKVVLDTRRFYGAVKERFHYQTNDPRLPTLVLTLIADVKSEE